MTTPNSIATLKQKVFEFIWYADSSRKATITFEWDPKKDRFVFECCIFSGVNKGCYDFDDFQFLNALSAEIIRLHTQECYEGGTYEK